MSPRNLKKLQGTTPAERYLAQLCERTFLSLWSYPNVSRDVFPGTSVGKEVCDLLVVFENRVLIFSDKDCAVPKTGNLQLDWSRWFRKAVVDSARQARGAERWLRQFPSRVFLDRECTVSLPVTLELSGQTRFHLIVVAHNIAERCQEALGGSGSLMIRSGIAGEAAHTEPFTVGDLDPNGSFVHVLDDASLNILMEELDTIADFTAYLEKKADLIRSGPDLFASGEEELLAWYLRHWEKRQGHFFKLPEGRVDGIAFFEGLYEEHLNHPQQRAKIKEDSISYAWDRLIDKFAFHAMNGSQSFASSGGIPTTERILRWMAREPRVRRRMLARQLVDCVVTTPAHLRRTMVLLPSSAGDPYYVYVMIPWNNHATYRTIAR